MPDNIPPKLQSLLRRIYGLPASITVITGKWKTGKTDFALLLTEYTEQLGLIKHGASNIETENSLEFVNDFQSLDFWLASNKQRKIYLYDEVVESSQRRRAMSSINVGWVKRIPQLSKSRCHLVAITQDINLTESVFLNWTFLRGVWTKTDKTTVAFNNPQWFSKRRKWVNLPPTTIKFDPYLPATFSESQELAKTSFIPSEYKRLVSSIQHNPKDHIVFADIAKELELYDKRGRPNTMEAARILKRLLLILPNFYIVTQPSSEGSKQPEIVVKR